MRLCALASLRFRIDLEVARKILTAMGLSGEAPVPACPERSRGARAPPIRNVFEPGQDSTVDFSPFEEDADVA